mgnify:CR=1 FL=1
MSGFSWMWSGEELVFRVALIGDASVVTFTTSEFAHLSVIFEEFSLLTVVGRSCKTSERKHVLLQPESTRAGKFSPLSVILTNFREDGAKLAYLHVSAFSSHSSLFISSRMCFGMSAEWRYRHFDPKRHFPFLTNAMQCPSIFLVSTLPFFF